MKLDIELIKRQLITKKIAQNIIYYEIIDSTQDEAKRIENICTDGTYIVTDKQVKGKGTHGRTWIDGGYENICGTLILKPNCHISKLEDLTLLIAKCFVNTIKQLYNINLNIKYPNDIMCNNKKMVGILTETITNKEIVQVIYIGIGINVNQLFFDSEIENIATSLRNEYKKEFSREEIIASFFNCLEKEYEKMIK